MTAGGAKGVASMCVVESQVGGAWTLVADAHA